MAPTKSSPSTRRPIVGGNWKMHLRRDQAAALTEEVCRASPGDNVDVALFPPFVYLETVARVIRERRSGVLLGAQDVCAEPDGAFTGEISVGMLQDLGVTHALAGHSERRHVFGESDDVVRRKCHALLAGGLTCVLCVGETLEQREAGNTDEVNERQLRAALTGVNEAIAAAQLVIAYEPVWAIGTGRNATPEDAQAAQAHIRSILVSLFNAPAANRIRIQYGGSVKPSNAEALFAQPDIDGGLIGGASLKGEDFLAICRAAAPSR